MAVETAEIPEPNVMRPGEAAAYTATTIPALNVMRCRGQGPAYIKVNGRIKYLRADLDAWLVAGRVVPPSMAQAL